MRPSHGPNDPQVIAWHRAAAAVVLALVEDRRHDAAVLLGRDDPATRDVAAIAYTLAVLVVRYHPAPDLAAHMRAVIDADNRDEREL